jgi:hypothetical protein
VRAEPPGITSGQKSKLDFLAGYETLPAEVKKPDFAQVVSPMSLASTLANDAGDWVVTAPSAAQLDAARMELGLAAGTPVPLTVGIAAAWPTPVVAPEGNGFAATKTIYLGEERANPTLSGLTIDGVEPPSDGEQITIMAGDPKKPYKTRLNVDADDSKQIVNWLSSCGTMHDFDLHAAYITIEEKDRTEGQLALVYRDEFGGVAWRLWPCVAQ